MAETLNKKQLYDLIWTRPMIEVAKEYGLSDRGLAKLCERHGIPVPPRGYWAKKKAGQKVTRPPLLVVDAKESTTTLLIKQAIEKQQVSTIEKDQAPEPILPEEIREAIERESLPKNKVEVPKTLASPHIIVAKWIDEEERALESYRKWGGWRKPEKPSELERRRRRIISALSKALEARGFKIEADPTYKDFIRVTHQWEEIGFTVSERIRQYRRELTPEEKKESSYPSKWRQVSEATGLLMLRIAREARGSSWSAVDFQETAERPLEDQLNAVIAVFIEKIWLQKKERLKHQEEDNRRWEQQKERERQAKLMKEENDRKAALAAKANDWKKARDIREYVAAVTSVFKESLAIDSDKLMAWKDWALAYADELDPIASGNPLIDLYQTALEAESEDQ